MELVKEEEIIIENDTYNSIGTYKIKVENGTIFITKNPTCNCQTYCIGEIRLILQCSNALKILQKIQRNYMGKTQLIVDIKTEYEDRLEKIFPKEYHIFKNKYTNANDSSMIFYLLKTDPIR